VPVLSCVMIIGLLTSITLREWSVLALVVAVATMLFIATRRRRAAIAAPAA
jgi:hypothetical protein